MPRGGFREGAGNKPTWNYGETTTIRVPKTLAEYLKAIARKIDQGESPFVVSKSKVLDLNGIKLTHIDGAIAVRLEDLVKAGYELHPEHLRVMVEARLKRLAENNT